MYSVVRPIYWYHSNPAGRPLTEGSFYLRIAFTVGLSRQVPVCPSVFPLFLFPTISLILFFLSFEANPATYMHNKKARQIMKKLAYENNLHIYY
jgi:hypothetical protein